MAKQGVEDEKNNSLALLKVVQYRNINSNPTAIQKHMQQYIFLTLDMIRYDGWYQRTIPYCLNCVSLLVLLLIVSNLD